MKQEEIEQGVLKKGDALFVVDVIDRFDGSIAEFLAHHTGGFKR